MMKNYSDPYYRPTHSFVRKYGLILSVSAAALILGATYAGTRSRIPAPEITQIPMTVSTPAPAVTTAPMIRETGMPQPTSHTPTPTQEPIKKPEPTTAPSLQILEPTVGTITRQFAGDKLIYSQTLAQWTAHSGMDVCADAGTAVLAALDGQVESVIQDPLLGNTVVLQHAGSITTVYASLADIIVRTGDTVTAGQTIASIGNTALSESNEGYHLHFEMYKDGKAVDPRPYLATDLN